MEEFVSFFFERLDVAVVKYKLRIYALLYKGLYSYSINQS